MKKFNLNLDTNDEENDEEKKAPVKKAPSKMGLGLNLDLISKKEDKISEMKEKMYDEYDPSSSSKREKGGNKEVDPKINLIGKSSNKPKFNLNVKNLGGSGIEGDADEVKKITGFGGGGFTPMAGNSSYNMSSTPNNANSNRPLTTMGAGIPDNASVVSQSPMNGGRISNRYRNRMGAAGITPMGSDMSRAKFDFSGYDPEAVRKQRPPSPDRKVIKKDVDDLEIFITDYTADPSAPDLEKKNQDSSQDMKNKVIKEIFDVGAQHGEAANIERLTEVQQFQSNIKDEPINAAYAYEYFNRQEYMAVQREQDLLDLQVGGQANQDQLMMDASHLEEQTLPALKLERLALELDQLEKELFQLEKSDIPSGYSDENDSASHLKEIDYLRIEMEKILGSEAFESLNGRSQIQDLLSEGTQISVQQALNELIETKIVEYSNGNQEGQFKIGDMITLNFSPNRDENYRNPELESTILQRYQQVDQSIDAADRIIGNWQPQNKFMTLYSHLDDLCDKVEDLDTRTMDIIGSRAKELNKDLEDIVRSLHSMSDVNYDKNKIDFLFMILERAIESDEHVLMIVDRLRGIEKIHRESPTIQLSITSLIDRQKDIDKMFMLEDSEIQRTKQIFLDNMQQVQIQLKEVTMLQKNKSN